MFGNILAITYIAKEINKYQSPKLTQNHSFTNPIFFLTKLGESPIQNGS